MTPQVRTALAALVAVGVTAVVLVRDERLAATGGDSQLVIDTAAATVGLMLAYLLYGRFRLRGLVHDLLLCLALLVLGAANALLSVLPAVVGDAPGRLTTAGVAAGLLAGLLYAAAVWVPPWVLAAGRPRARVLYVLVPAVLALALVWSVRTARPGSGAADSFGGTDDLLVSLTQGAAALAFLVAAVGWSRPAAQGDSVAAPLAVAAVFGAGSRIDFAVAEGPMSAWVAAGTLLRVLFYVALVAAAVLEVQALRRRVAEVAVLEERRRLARELHDGLAQELAFIVTQARGLREQSTNRRAQLVVRAAERALDESRRAIAALTRSLDEPLEVALGQTVEEVANRFGTRVRLDLAPGMRVEGEQREALLRIAREAVANAGRHGGASSVVVSLALRDGLRLTVLDDGQGFDATAPAATGSFGLLSMRERAEALGGSLQVDSRPGATTLEVHLP